MLNLKDEPKAAKIRISSKPSGCLIYFPVVTTSIYLSLKNLSKF